MRPMHCVFYTSNGPSFMRSNVLDQMLDCILQQNILKIRSASDTKLPLYGTFTILVFIGESETRKIIVTFGKLSVPVLLGTPFIDRFVSSTYTYEGKTVPHYSTLANIPMVHEA